MSYKAILFRYKECICIIPLVFRLFFIAGILFIVCGIIDLYVAKRAPYYFREAMQHVYHGDGSASIAKMKRDARNVAIIWIIAGVFLIALPFIVVLFVK